MIVIDCLLCNKLDIFSAREQYFSLLQSYRESLSTYTLLISDSVMSDLHGIF